ncbi:glycosyltransferase [Pseudoalteromonas sp. OOF1S-7]|uniref:glycosyltransferase n=1 Tax=Pseudoalteromonas sp. OOF1S-7 TaxID=2917757 RepID=UPI001EF69CB3|nr:glycosyltransferase [Pseudoalteromonas sp. OOF1S-7]MCG7536364.1 glycosyltransferase [Pseudoalteromonas sp. OOF1S-7]
MLNPGNSIDLSVVCIAFNQEGYIEDALKSFLNQKTTLNTEIVVYDDCSTDKTREIISRYAQMHPEKIRLLFPDENQYSKMRTLPTITALGAAKGDYIAMCEGDDYWDSEDKLEAQYQAMQAHPDVALSFHPAINLYPDGKKTNNVNLGDEIKLLSFEEVIKGGGGLMATATLMFKRCAMTDLPVYLEGAPVGDMFIQMVAAAEGGAIYVPGVYSMYRREAENSWSSERSGLAKAHLLKERDAFVMSLKRVEKLGVTSELIDYCIARELAYLAISALKSRHYDLTKQFLTESEALYKGVNSSQKILSMFKHALPLLRRLHSLKKKFL